MLSVPYGRVRHGSRLVLLWLLPVGWVCPAALVGGRSLRGRGWLPSRATATAGGVGEVDDAAWKLSGPWPAWCKCKAHLGHAHAADAEFHISQSSRALVCLTVTFEGRTQPQSC